MIQGFEDLERIKGKVANLDKLIENAIFEIDVNIDRAITDQINAGTDPYGNKWPPKKDGSQALVSIKKYVTLTVTKEGIHIRLDGPAYYANMTRQIVPNQKIPQLWLLIIKEAFTKSFKDIIK